MMKKHSEPRDLDELIEQIGEDIEHYRKGWSMMAMLSAVNFLMALSVSIRDWACDDWSFLDVSILLNLLGGGYAFFVCKRYFRRWNCFKRLRKDMIRARQANTQTERELYVDQVDAIFNELKKT